MSGAAGGLLAGSVSRAGGFGFIGGGYFDPKGMQQNLDEAERALSQPQSDGTLVNARGKDGRLEIGVGFLAWRLSQMDGISTTGAGNINSANNPKAAQYIDTVLLARPRAIWLSFGSSSELVGWAEYLRKRERAINGSMRTLDGAIGGEVRGDEGWKLFVGVGSLEEARVAVEDVGAEVIVAQSMSRLSIFLLLTSILLKLHNCIVSSTYLPLLSISEYHYLSIRTDMVPPPYIINHFIYPCTMSIQLLKLELG